MRKLSRAIWAYLLCATVILTGVPSAGAIDVSATPATELATSSPLMITAYQTTGAATTLLAVEVYNDGDVPLSLSNWKLTVTAKDTTTYDVATSTSHTGLLLPGEHVVYAPGDTTTYALTATKQVSQIVSIEFHYVGADIVYKSASALIKDTLDLPLFRAYTSTGYSTATQPFAASPARNFYDDGLYQAPTAPDGVQIVEIYPYASDCAPNDGSILCGDYVKLYNSSDHDISLDEFVLRTDSSSSSRTSSNTVTLGGMLNSRDIVTISLVDSGGRLSLTNSGGFVWLEDVWGLTRYDTTMTQYASAGTSEQGYAYAQASDATWQWTTTPQPTGANLIIPPIIEVTECPVGKYRNPDTGRCRTLEETVNALATCDEGYERNVETNRCRKIVTATAASITPCLEGQERNSTTNRCRSIASAVAELMPCDEGYERNPETNRCRKVQIAAMPLAAFPVQPITETKGDSAGTIALAAVATIAVGYIVWEWRREIARILRNAVGFLARSK